MVSNRDTKTIVNGSALSDATCDSMVDPRQLCVFSTIHVALIGRYIRQAELVHRARKSDRAPVDVLDIGCNNGAALRLYASRNFQTPGRQPVNYVGLDLDLEALNKARANVPRGTMVASAEFHYTDITERWPVDDESFDVLWYTECIEHVPSDKAQATLHEAWRVARPGATMLLSTPAPFITGTGTSNVDEMVWPESHLHEFSREEMRRMIDAAGWRRVDEYGLNTNWIKGRARLRRAHPELYNMYETMRGRLGGTLARTFIAALAPDMCDDLVHICVKEA